MSIINQQAKKPRLFSRGFVLALPIFTGSDPSAADGRSSEVSEWQRSADEEGALPPTKMLGTATGQGNYRLAVKWMSSGHP